MYLMGLKSLIWIGMVLTTLLVLIPIGESKPEFSAECPEGCICLTREEGFKRKLVECEPLGMICGFDDLTGEPKFCFWEMLRTTPIPPLTPRPTPTPTFTPLIPPTPSPSPICPTCYWDEIRRKCEGYCPPNMTCVEVAPKECTCLQEEIPCRWDEEKEQCIGYCLKLGEICKPVVTERCVECRCEPCICRWDEEKRECVGGCPPGEICVELAPRVCDCEPIPTPTPCPGNFLISILPKQAKLPITGGSINYSVMISATGGFNQPLSCNLSVSGPIKKEFYLGPVYPPYPQNFSYTVNIPAGTPPGTYTGKISCVDCGLERSDTTTLTVPGFEILLGIAALLLGLSRKRRA